MQLINKNNEYDEDFFYVVGMSFNYQFEDNVRGAHWEAFSKVHVSRRPDGATLAAAAREQSTNCSARSQDKHLESFFPSLTEY